MPNTKPVGVAYADPEFESVEVTGTLTAAEVSADTLNVDAMNVGGNLGVAGTLDVTGEATFQGPVVGSVGFTGNITGVVRPPLNDTPAAGSNQGNAATLSPGFCTVSGADDTKGVIINSPSGVSAVNYVINVDAGKLKIYPPVGGTIDALATNAPLVIDGQTSCILVGGSGLWYSIGAVVTP